MLLLKYKVKDASGGGVGDRKAPHVTESMSFRQSRTCRVRSVGEGSDQAGRAG